MKTLFAFFAGFLFLMATAGDISCDLGYGAVTICNLFSLDSQVTHSDKCSTSSASCHNLIHSGYHCRVQHSTAIYNVVQENHLEKTIFFRNCSIRYGLNKLPVPFIDTTPTQWLTIKVPGRISRLNMVSRM